MIKEAIGILVDGKSLTMIEAASVMEEIMTGQATPAQLGAFMTALRIKGESGDEIAGLASVMRAKAIHIHVDMPVLDIVGTGGDGLNTFNISTAAAFVAAGAGLNVAKHGNRAAGSKCGSADVLEALGIKIDLDAEQVRRCIEEVGIGFMYAPSFHPAMKYAAAPRKEIGIRTVFNILGPLTNPAGARHQVIGVPNPELGDKISNALLHLELKHALVVYGLNGMDEISISDGSILWEVKDSKMVAFRKYISPDDFGLKKSSSGKMLGGSPEINAGIIRSILSGEKSPRRDVVLMNAAAGLLAGDRVDILQQGIRLAVDSIDSGRALQKMDQLIKFSQIKGQDHDTGSDSKE